jgi:hypothetical protein
MCYILCMCVCVGASDTTTASDDPSPRALSLRRALPRGVPGGGRYLRAAFGRFLLFLADFAIFS